MFFKENRSSDSSYKNQGTHTKLASGLVPHEYKMAKERGSGWYRSKKPVPVYDAFVGAGYLSNKTWPLQEESSYNNMITFSMNTPCNLCVIPNGKLITDFYSAPSEISTGQFYSGTIRYMFGG